MEKFTTLLTENYSLQQELYNLVKNYVNHETEELYRINVTPEFVEISFKPNFGSTLGAWTEAMEAIAQVASDYPIIDKLDSNENVFSITLKKR